MRGAFDVAAVRRAEDALRDTLPEGALMARAAQGLATTCARMLGQVYGARVAVLVGSGDNGGDALFAGAQLAARGARVDAILLGRQAHAGGLAALRRAGGRVVAEGAGSSSVARAALLRAGLVLDGIVGIGGRGGLREGAASLVESLRDSDAWRVAVDLPSGVDADTGAVAGTAFQADVTVTFGCLKPGLLVGSGHTYAGIVEVVNINLGPWLADRPSVQAADLSDVVSAWPQPGPDDDKYTRGVVGVIAGSASYAGAAVLCVGAAVRSGAGMVRFVGADDVGQQVRARWPEAVVGTGRVQAWVVGPGLGTGPEALERLREVLSTDLPVLVDADALTVLAGHQELLRERTALTVLTPHDREFERFGRPIGDDRVAAARGLAADLGVCVLLKGSATVVVDREGAAYVNPTGTAWLATAGTGDVLSGLTGMLLAAGLGSSAPVLGAFVHGLAGRTASAGGPASALDVVNALPSVVAGFLAGSGSRGRIAR